VYSHLYWTDGKLLKKKNKQTSVTFLFFNTFDTYNKKRKNVPETEHLVFLDGFSFLFLSLSLSLSR